LPLVFLAPPLSRGQPTRRLQLPSPRLCLAARHPAPKRTRLLARTPRWRLSPSRCLLRRIHPCLLARLGSTGCSSRHPMAVILKGAPFARERSQLLRRACTAAHRPQPPDFWPLISDLPSRLGLLITDR